MSGTEIYSAGKKVFSEINDSTEFLFLESSRSLYEKLHQAILEEPFSLMLLYGPPGVGKTFLLRKLLAAFEDQLPIYLYRIPFKTIEEFLEKMYRQFLEIPYRADRPFRESLELLLETLSEPYIIVFLDEVQLYSPQELESIRLLSDTGRFKFVLAMHQLKEEDLLMQEYFSSRIWSMVRVDNMQYNEAVSYIEKRLLQNNLQELVMRFSPKAHKLIFRLTNGNYRHINRLLYRLFDIYEHFDVHRPSMIKASVIEPKFLEMAALDLGLIRA